jgi:hypothetical protein
MGEPSHRVAADAAVALGDVGPSGVFPQMKKNTLGALVCAKGQNHWVAFAELRAGGCAHRVVLLGF